jgi:hypothetical protein
MLCLRGYVASQTTVIKGRQKEATEMLKTARKDVSDFDVH